MNIRNGVKAHKTQGRDLFSLFFVKRPSQAYNVVRERVEQFVLGRKIISITLFFRGGVSPLNHHYKPLWGPRRAQPRV